jgi:hypothetical protein
LYHYHVTS